ncbi:MAG: ABC transporter permease subunit [Actinomycetota bacterium]|nr:ABC transporter permease subunit [Actinomycetota bacterium]
MNVFLRELRAHRTALIFWCIGMFAMVGSGMGKYAAYESSGTSVNTLVRQLPRAVQIILGMGSFDLSKAIGFYGVLYLYLIVMATIHAAVLGAEIISKEERDRTSEFLFAKPVPRTKVITAKLLAALANMIVLNLVTLVSSIWVVDYYNKGGRPVTGDIVALMAGMFFLQLIFLSIGMSIAAIRKKPKSAASIATAVLLATFILSVAIDINNKLEFLKYLTPFKYFDAQDILPDGRLDLGYVALSGGIIIVLLAVTYRFYAKRDLSI